jgi:hypothetical protein
VNVRQHVLDRLETLGWSHYRLATALKGKVPPAIVYRFLKGESAINSDALGHIFDALKLTIKEGKK